MAAELGHRHSSPLIAGMKFQLLKGYCTRKIPHSPPLNVKDWKSR